MKSSVTFCILLIFSVSWISSVVRATAETSPGTQLSKHVFDEMINESQEGGSTSDSIKPDNSAGATMVKRAAARPYSFGLGKKSMPTLADLLNEARLRNQVELSESESNPQYYDDGATDFDDGQRASDKRGEQRVRTLIGKPLAYSFGLGKRGSNWIGRISSLPEPSYLGDIKRRYSFGLGK